MVGRKAVAGLSLLSALLFCAFAVQSASAAVAVNTTAFTCTSTAKVLDFSDAHCDNKVAPPSKFGHTEIAPKTKTAFTVTNAETLNETKEATSQTLKGELFGTKLEITCKTVHGTGTLENTEKEKQHNVEGEGTVKFTNCEVKKPAKCTVKEPIEFTSKAVGVEGLGAGKNEMGLEFKPAAGEIFVSIILEGAECALKGKPLEVKGSAIGTGKPAPTEKHAGATGTFNAEKEMEKLTIGGKPAEFIGGFTIKMAEKEPGLSLTTTT